MTGFALSPLSLSRMHGIHPDLDRVVKRAIQISPVDFMVVEGLRTLEKQQEYFAKAKTTTMNSRHLTGHAVDLAAYIDGKLDWNAPAHDHVSDAMKTAASELNVDLEWGGDWTSFVDTPHYQLSWKSYPKQDESWKGTQADTEAPQDAQIRKDLAETSTKFKAASRAKKAVGISAVLVALQQALVNFGNAIGEFFGSVSIAETITLVNHATTLITEAWVGLAAAAGAALYFVFGWFQERQVEEVKKGTYQPSRGEF